MSLEICEVKNLKGVLVLKPKVYKDSRGWFIETFKESSFEKLKLPTHFVQDNHSCSEQKNVLRGLHFQIKPYAQGKLVRCTRGKILDVIVDLRRDSKSFLKWESFDLSDENNHMLWIPEGFAHGFLTLTEISEVQYKTTNEYSPVYERSIRWNDPIIAVQWGLSDPILNAKDNTAPLLKDINKSDFFA